MNLNPSYVFWNYNGKIITYDRERGGTVVIRFEILRQKILSTFLL